MKSLELEFAIIDRLTHHQVKNRLEAFGIHERFEGDLEFLKLSFMLKDKNTNKNQRQRFIELWDFALK